MAPSVVQHASSTTVYTSGTSATTSLSFPGNTTAGNTLVAAFNLLNYTSTPTVTVTTNGTAENWTEVPISNPTDGIFIYVNANTGGGQQIIDVNWTFGATATSTNADMILLDTYEIAGSTGVVDKSAINTSSTSPLTVTTAATTKASEIAIGVGGALLTATSTVTGSSTGGWTSETAHGTSFTYGGTASDSYQVSGYNVLSSTGTVSYVTTSSNTGAIEGVQGIVITLEASTGNTSTVAMSYRPAQAFTVNVAPPVTTTIASQFSPAMAFSTTVANPTTTTFAMGFNPAMSFNTFSLGSNIAMAFNPAMAFNVTVVSPIVATFGLNFNPAINFNTVVANPITTTFGMNFNPAMNFSTVVAPAITTTFAMAFNPTMHFVVESLGSNIAMSFRPAMAFNSTVSGPYTSNIAMDFNPAMSFNVITANPITAAFAMAFNPAMSFAAVQGNTLAIAMSFSPAMHFTVNNTTTRTAFFQASSNAGTDEYGNAYIAGALAIAMWYPAQGTAPPTPATGYIIYSSGSHLIALDSTGTAHNLV